MPETKRRGLVAAITLWLACAPFLSEPADAAASAGPVSSWRRATFVIGAPGRLDAAGDRRYPRFYRRADSAVGAYADIEEVQDGTWLRHEIEHYARRAVDCAGLAETWCRRDVRRFGPMRVIALFSGAHAELVWLAAGNRAVRLGWRRIVDTPAGTLTLDTPPWDFTSAVLGEFPSALEGFEFDPRQDRVWAATETDRLLYYIDQVVAALPAVLRDEHRRHALRFVEENLAQINRLRVLQLDDTPAGVAPRRDFAAVEAVGGVLPAALAEQLDAVRAWRSGIAAGPWCPAPLTAAAAMSPLAGWRP
jgi:hypothetical protein